MTTVTANGIEIEYEAFGDRDDPTILLVMGLGNQLTMWHRPFCDRLVEQGYHVVRFDNRDVGLSEKFDHAGKPDVMGALFGGQRGPAPYTLDEMAADALGLADTLGIESLHVAGISMGGMIAQTMAINHPERVASLTSIMSATGNPDVPRGTPEAMRVLVRPPADPSDPEAVIQRGLEMWDVIGSPEYPTPDERRKEWLRRDFERSHYPDGIPRQLMAIIDHGDRSEGLRTLDIPAVVLHGAADPLIPVEAGEDTASVIPEAELRVIEGMGHDFPLELIDTFADAILDAAARS